MKPQNILVRMPNWVGDLVMATPILSDLRQAFPNASITAMCRRPTCDLLKEDPSIDELFCFEKIATEFVRGDLRRNIIAKIQNGNFDVGILLTSSFSSAWWFWQANVKQRIGFTAHFRRWLLTHPIEKPKESMHQVDQFKKLLAPLGISPSKTPPRLFVLEKEIEEAKQLLYQRGYIKGKKIIGINPGAAYGTAKCWLPERFEELARRLTKEDVFVVFFGDVSNLNLIKAICADLPKQVINLAGFTSLRELACLVKECTVLVTNDSGPMHIAAAFGVAVVALFGSTDDKTTGPYENPEAVIHKQVSCSPCFKRVCPIDFRCMKEITVDEVEKRVLSLLYV